MKLCLIVDNSGSLVEGGRRFIERTVLRHIRRMLAATYPDVELCLYMLSDAMREQDWSSEEDVPEQVLLPNGSLSLDPLLQLAPDDDRRILFVTDYCLEPAGKKRLRRWVESMTTARARLVVVGDSGLVDKRSAGIFTAEQLDGVLDGLLGVPRI